MQIFCKEKKLKVIIIGTIVSGKSKLSISLANHFQWDIINTDANWFFKKADILTSKASKEELEQTHHHCVDFLEMEDRSFEMKHFEGKVNRMVDSQFKTKQGIVIVGGSNFYNEKVIFQQRSKLKVEEEEDFYTRLKHNINVFLNELMFHEQLKGIADNLELNLYFQKLIQKETKISHECLKSSENKLKYILLNAPTKMIDIIFTEFELSPIVDFFKKLFPFGCFKVNLKDSLQVKKFLLNFVTAKKTDLNKEIKTEEELNKKAEEDMLVVILQNNDSQLVSKLIKQRVTKMFFEKKGIHELFYVFERLLIKPNKCFNLIEKYLYRAKKVSCSLEEIILMAFKDVTDMININKANRYGVLTTRGYKEFFPFFEKFLFALVNKYLRNTFHKVKKENNYDIEIYRSQFFKAYTEHKSALIKNLEDKLPEVLSVNGKIEEMSELGILTQAFLENIYSMESDMYLLYKKQHAWLQKRIVMNELLENKIIVKEVTESVLTDKAFAKEVIEPITKQINSIISNKEQLSSFASFSTQIVKSPTRKSTFMSKTGEDTKQIHNSNRDSIIQSESLLSKRDFLSLNQLDKAKEHLKKVQMGSGDRGRCVGKGVEVKMNIGNKEP
jgi:tRNA A37 N6-isopentenylltransferase MiaA